LPQKRATLLFVAVRCKRWTRQKGRVASVANKGLPAIYLIYRIMKELKSPWIRYLKTR